MNIQYQRNLKNSYMVVIESGQTLNPDGQLAEKMMQRRPIPELLTWVTMEHAGDMTFWYQINGLQSLSECLQQQMLDHALLKKLLSGLLALQEELPRYYLKPEHLLLREEQIFLDLSTQQMRFCYEPLWSGDPRSSLRALLEQLLVKVDHADKYAVRLAYGLYEKCQEENADLWAYVLEQLEIRSDEPETTAETDMREQSLPDSANISLQQAEPQAEITPVSEPAPEKKHLSAAWVHGMADKLEKLPHSSPLAWLQSVRKDRHPEKQAETLYLFEPEEEAALCEHPTVYLGAGTQAEGRLSYQGSGAEQSYVIRSDTFLIGARNTNADAQLQGTDISRSHARITKEQDVYYVEDLNSRNGTYVNEELLVYHQKRRLNSGDRLRFAREEYIFY